jgi:hypothetical protein
MHLISDARACLTYQGNALAEVSQSQWGLRVERDAEQVFRYLRDQFDAGRRAPFSISELYANLSLPRDRIYGALVFLVRERKQVGVEERSSDKAARRQVANTATFYPLNSTGAPQTQ